MRSDRARLSWPPAVEGLLLLLQLQLVLVLLLPSLVLQPAGVNAIDPEYELSARIKQILTAVVDNYLRPGAESRAAPNSSVTFRCRYAANSEFVIVHLDRHQLRHRQQREPLSSAIDLRQPLAILVHGWFDNYDRTWYNRTATEYQRHVGGNFCTLDWGYLAANKYSVAASSTRVVAGRVVQFVRQLAALGLPLQQVTLIGHSFGAQIAGMAGAQLGGRLGRIFGLDPAGWLFTKPNMIGLAERLDRSDAQYVQCMHTAGNTIGLGSGVECGHQDFYPNDGLAPQPGCIRPREDGGLTHSLLTCSHFKAVQYFIASLNPANRFRAWRCSRGYAAWSRGICAAGDSDLMGVHSRNRVSGKLYLRTVIPEPFVAD